MHGSCRWPGEMTYLQQPTLKYPCIEKIHFRISDIYIANITVVRTQLVWANTQYVRIEAQSLTHQESTIQKPKHGVGSELKLVTEDKSDSTGDRSDRRTIPRRKSRYHSPNLTPAPDVMSTMSMNCYLASSGSREYSPPSSPHRSFHSH